MLMFGVRLHITPGTSVKELKSSVCWEYKWEDKADAKVFGPYTTDTMIQWKEQVRAHALMPAY